MQPQNSIEIKVIQARGLPKADAFGKIDPYFILVLGNDTQKTTTKKNTYEPIFTENFVFSKDISPTNNEVLIKLMDWDLGSKDEHIASLRVAITGEYVNRKVRKWFKLTNTQEKEAGEVELEIIHTKPGGGSPQGPHPGQGAPVIQRSFPPPAGGQGPPPAGGYPPPPGGQYPPPPGGQYPPPPGGQYPPPPGGQYPPPPGGQYPPPQGYSGPPAVGGQPPPMVVVQQAPTIIIQRTGPLCVYIKQQVFTLGDHFNIMDENGVVMFVVKGDFFTIGKKLHILGAGNEEVAYIHEKVLTLWAQYDVDIRKPDVFTFTVKREYKIGFGHNFNVLGLNWTLKGDFGAHDYRVFKEDGVTQVMYLHKKWCSWGDSYELCIMDHATLLPCVCIALSIDAFLAKDQGNDSDHPQSHYHSHHHHW